ncbi:hypothetical protein IHN63_00150 [Deinococcus sp. 6YEL10]|uniref:hypothetical protein n=1 Tax=Deinococcus sp. 6YEL10 TaxID=2745870 RepID=UPI001E460F4A|nr:hypothetical protein [Deinococcus sp. 6YEL10]MCD0159709.1 hypothetical protein [Deinococcus sp. 6YEL10]
MALPGERGVQIHGSTVVYRLVDGGLPAGIVGQAVPNGPRRCLVKVLRPYQNNVMLVAHELGHCMDFQRLGPPTDIREGDGCVYGPYFCGRMEGYAQTYARVYVRKCGPSLADLGVWWATDEGTGCVPPRAEEVTRADLPDN